MKSSKKPKTWRISPVFKIKTSYDTSKRWYYFYLNDAKSRYGYDSPETAFKTGIQVLYQHLKSLIVHIEKEYPEVLDGKT